MVVLMVMILTGIMLAMQYTPNVDLAFNSVERIMRDVNSGWLLRYIHMNGASMFFIVVYIHIFRGMYYGSYKNPRELLWILGVVILVLMMATAFMGYVLPWGQMSFWGATVITSLTTYQSYLDEAFLEIQNRLINTGRRPNLVISPYSLRDVHLYLTLALIFEDLSTRLNEAYELRAQKYRAHYERCWGELKMLIDTDDSGEADDVHHRTAANPTVWLGGRGGTRWLP